LLDDAHVGRKGAGKRRPCYEAGRGMAGNGTDQPPLPRLWRAKEVRPYSQ